MKNESLVRRPKKSSSIGVWSIIGGVALVAVAAGLVVALPDIQRYLKMRAM